MKRIVVLCDNTMGIPGNVFDDGLALMYLLGLGDVHIEAICCTHGNNTTANTFQATCRLVEELGLDVPVFRGADAGSDQTSEAARYIAEAPDAHDGLMLLSLGATTDLAAAQKHRPGCLARYRTVSLMGGITHSLVVGGKILDELNFSVDGNAACETLRAAQEGAKLVLADAWNCLPLTFGTNDFRARLIDPGFAASSLLEAYCLPWMEFAHTTWGVDGFVGWDVLAAVALARPDYVVFEPFEVACNPQLLGVGYLERAQDATLAAPISLVVVRSAQELCEHIYKAWEQAAQV
ncbi:MAG: nucleoside hydrolase [Eggerthellaceae bacterium]|nr:nucleoside hydrolase [Eggerthellaceae bacterium]